MNTIKVTTTVRDRSSLTIVVDKILYFYCDTTYRIVTSIHLITGETIDCEESVAEVQKLIEQATAQDLGVK